MKAVVVAAAFVTALAAGCGREAPVGGAAGDARPATIAVNAGFAKEIDLDPASGLADAKRGFVARPSGKILAVSQANVMRQREHEFTWGDRVWAHWSQTAHVVLTQ